MDPGNESSDLENKESSDGSNSGSSSDVDSGGNSEETFTMLLEQCPSTLFGEVPPNREPNFPTSELPGPKIIDAQIRSPDELLKGPGTLEVADGPDQAMDSFTCTCHGIPNCPRFCVCPNKCICHPDKKPKRPKKPQTLGKRLKRYKS